jgi:DNA-directed RNA polymerase specialized sigma24 family protein
VATFNSLTDHDLVDLLKSDDKAAFMELYDRYHDTIFRFIRKYLKSSELSEDICQNVFFKDLGATRKPRDHHGIRRLCVHHRQTPVP